MVAAASSALWMLVLGQGGAVLLALVMTALILWRHRSNIARIRAGTEPKIGQKD
jgi:glycerol-3-phosphate acyltransferase PlsY